MVSAGPSGYELSVDPAGFRPPGSRIAPYQSVDADMRQLAPVIASANGSSGHSQPPRLCPNPLRSALPTQRIAIHATTSEIRWKRLECWRATARR
jgi:hypothetical protein